MITELRNLPAPAKLNLFLHVTGQRSDGYHLLETAFEMIDLCDTIDLHAREDGLITLLSPTEGIEPHNNLVVRAAQALARMPEAQAGTRIGTGTGVAIGLHKRIPIGGGLGGGSSDAATVLLGLNRLWNLQLSPTRLAEIGLSLGADVPFFLYGRSALGTGIGEQLRPIELPIRQYLLVQPAVSVPTARIFQAPELTRNSKPLKIEGFSQIEQAISDGKNDLQPVVEMMYPQVKLALRALRRSVLAVRLDPGQVRMSGSGACVFVPLDHPRTASSLMNRIRQDSQTAAGGQAGQLLTESRAWVVNSLSRHPLGQATD